MADTQLTGCIYGNRQGSVIVNQSCPIAALTSTTATIFMRVMASAQAPVIIEAQVVVLTADSGSTPTISVGVTATATEIINGASTATGATGGTFLPASNAVGKRILIADTDLYFKQGGTPTGDGVTYILLKIYGVNTSTITGIN